MSPIPRFGLSNPARCIYVWEIDELFKKYKVKGVPFKQEIVDRSWGHRSFSVLGPNGLVLFFFQEQF